MDFVLSKKVKKDVLKHKREKTCKIRKNWTYNWTMFAELQKLSSYHFAFRNDRAEGGRNSHFLLFIKIADILCRVFSLASCWLRHTWGIENSEVKGDWPSYFPYFRCARCLLLLSFSEVQCLLLVLDQSEGTKTGMFARSEPKCLLVEKRNITSAPTMLNVLVILITQSQLSIPEISQSDFRKQTHPVSSNVCLAYHLAIRDDGEASVQRELHFWIKYVFVEF